MKSLFATAVYRFARRSIGRALLVFIPAGTIHYWQGWAYLGTVTLTEAAVAAYVVKRDPELARRRIDIGVAAEKRPAQKVVIALMAALSGLLLVIPGLDHRFGWSHVPPVVSLVADAGILAAIILVFFVFRENTFASATIAVFPEQRVISTGPYARVRHPMYSAVLLFDLFAPLALGSWLPLPLWFVAAGLLIARLVDEERMLLEKLAGYAEYCARVPFRLIPGIW